MQRPTANRIEGQHRKVGEGVSQLKEKLSHGGRVALVLSIVALIVLVAFGALPRIFQQRALVVHTDTELAQAPYVSVTIAKPSPAIEEFTLPGNTQAIQDAPIYARVDGYLRSRYANIGDHVHAGEILADIDTPELDQQVQAAASAVEQARANLDSARQSYHKAVADEHTAEANVRKAKTDLQYFSTELDRYKHLEQQGAVSTEDRDSRLQAYNAGVATLDAAAEAVKSAQASVNSSRAAVNVAQAAMDAAQAQHDQYEATRSFRKVRAPFDGVVTQRNVDAGALITAGSNSSNSLLFEVAKTDILRVFVYVPEQYVSYIHAGEQALLNFDEYQGQDFVGIVSNVSGGIEPVSKTLQVEIHVPNPDHRLLPGMYAQVHFEFPAQMRLPIVPATTVQTRADGLYMYTVDKDNRVQMHKVDIGRDLGGQFEVAKGIAMGDKVIVNASDQLRDGMLVKSVMAQSEGKDSQKSKN